MARAFPRLTWTSYRSANGASCTSTFLPLLRKFMSVSALWRTLIQFARTHRLELVIWFAPNLLAGAISVSFVGFFLGPMYPILMNHAGRILPHELMSGAIGWIASWGAAGAAIFPFITGAIASKAGIGSLQPV